MHIPSLTEFLVIGFIGMVLLGPDKLPSFAKQVGGLWKSIKSYQHRIEEGFREQMPNMPSTTEMARMARSPVSLLNKLADFDITSEAVREDPGAVPVAHDDEFPVDPSGPEGSASSEHGVPTSTPLDHQPTSPFADPNLN